jgi:membrane-associated phospholipid phosphatase
VPVYLLLIGYLFFKRKFAYGIDVLIICAGSTALNQALKQVFHRHRPDHPIISGVVNYSFPSGHALSAFVFCSIVAYIVHKLQLSKPLKWLLTCLLALFAIAIALSRVTLKVHYPTDVLASFCLGAVWVILCFWILNRINQSHNWAQSDVANQNGNTIKIN